MPSAVHSSFFELFIIWPISTCHFLAHHSILPSIVVHSREHCHRIWSTNSSAFLRNVCTPSIACIHQTPYPGVYYGSTRKPMSWCSPPKSIRSCVPILPKFAGWVSEIHLRLLRPTPHQRLISPHGDGESTAWRWERRGGEAKKWDEREEESVDINDVYRHNSINMNTEPFIQQNWCVTIRVTCKHRL